MQNFILTFLKNIPKLGKYHLPNLSKYFETLFILSFMDLKLRYQNSILGFMWSFIRPSLQFIVYFIIFKKMLNISTEQNYALILFFGILTWTWFAESTAIGVGSFMNKKALISKIKTNKSMPPLSAYLTCTINYIGNLIIFLFLYLIFVDKIPSKTFSIISLLIFIKSLLELSILIISINLIISNLNVLYRDIQQLWEICLSYGVFLTPIIYRLPIPQNYETYYYLTNLLAMPLLNLKSIFFENQAMLWKNAELSCMYWLILTILFFISVSIHNHFNKKIVDFL